MFRLRSKSVLAFYLIQFVAIELAIGFTTSPSRKHYTTSHAAKGGGKKKASPARTTKGFGAPPPTLEEVIAKFRTRVPDDADSQPCPCGGRSETNKLYGDCCGPLHRKERLALTMTDVLRSRFSAFSWRLINYVMDSTHETCRDYLEDRVAWANSLNKYGMFDSFEFVKLEPGPEELSAENENEGFIEFNVTLRAKDPSYLEDVSTMISGQETKITERSRFVRDPTTGVWTYASGEVRSNVAGLEDTSLNT
ncbi:hypothetical protein HJC23_004024 [Cyclotella cryptica]|uniref:YchJ-like middle NTF2-like domain-containing protein n=1 Tax=Cyclotella cryptica TaxID=29204 RepID=A0ABD3QTP1_9STRA|eukprot:CCRYP_002025-RA/>CCRYP_002025-RA protein AED:0.23 eAED:0.23 QI:0/-1/0/1/-1/1/1/0/250